MLLGLVFGQFVDLVTPAQVSRCTLSIVRCCDPINELKKLPGRCFETNGCAGLIWVGISACSTGNVAKAVQALNPDLAKMNILEMDFNSVDIEIEKDDEDVRTNPEQDNRPGVRLTALSASGVMSTVCTEHDLAPEEIVLCDRMQVKSNTVESNRKGDGKKKKKNKNRRKNNNNRRKTNTNRRKTENTKRKNKNKQGNKDEGNNKLNKSISEGCPGDSIEICMNVCPSKPVAAFSVCVGECGSRC